jgi:glycosyltransferase involved in cell wall biosynthesis
MSKAKKKLLFVSPRFLFPADSGGKIRTSQILRGMKGGVFDITLISPAPDNIALHQDALDAVCDRFIGWPEEQKSPLYSLTRMRHIFARLPIPVITDRSREGSRLVEQELARAPDVVVFDFPHAAIHAPDDLKIPSVMFTHNVEAEIFLRHTTVASNPIARMIWNDQYRKMLQFERSTLEKFDLNIAVSQKDAEYFSREFSLDNVREIPTGTDLDYYAYHKPCANKNLVFTGSMDWSANIDGIRFFMESVWPLLLASEAQASLQIVGRNPPAQLVKRYSEPNEQISFTGFVDDVRNYVWNSAAYIIPLRVGSGTRIKAFEAMAMGCPIVSTSLGVEGLEMEPGKHYLRADTPQEFNQAIQALLSDQELRETISRNARKHVEMNFSSQRVSERFADICLEAIDVHKSRRAPNSLV